MSYKLASYWTAFYSNIFNVQGVQKSFPPFPRFFKVWTNKDKELNFQIK